jgi:transposase-like protein
LERQAAARQSPGPAAEAHAIALSADGGHVRSVRSYQVRWFEGLCRKLLPTWPHGLSWAATVSADQRAMIEFKGSHFERDVILWAVRWYVAYPISYRQLEEMMEEHGVEFDHATVNRWVLKYVPLLEQAFRARKATWRNGTPEKTTIDKSGANKAAIESHNADHEAGIEIRQIKYLNNIVEQDHRTIKRLVRPMLGFKSFRSAAVTLAGIELMPMIRKGQLQKTGEMCPAPQFYPLAG